MEYPGLRATPIPARRPRAAPIPRHRPLPPRRRPETAAVLAPSGLFDERLGRPQHRRRCISGRRGVGRRNPTVVGHRVRDPLSQPRHGVALPSTSFGRPVGRGVMVGRRRPPRLRRQRQRRSHPGGPPRPVSYARRRGSPPPGRPSAAPIGDGAGGVGDRGRGERSPLASAKALVRKVAAVRSAAAKERGHQPTTARRAT